MTNLDLVKPPQEMRELTLLQELEKNPVISQRELSSKFGIALGVTNACLKRMAHRGWIRILGLNRRKMGYYLTPKGFTEKAKLGLHLAFWKIQHYSALKEIIQKRLLEMQNAGVGSIVFYGVSDEMEIAYVTLQQCDLELIGIVEDEEKNYPNSIFGYEVGNVSDVMFLGPDGILITSFTDGERRMKKLQDILSDQRIKIGRF